jgi:hypothetical protein
MCSIKVLKIKSLRDSTDRQVFQDRNALVHTRILYTAQCNLTLTLERKLWDRLAILARIGGAIVDLGREITHYSLPATECI